MVSNFKQGKFELKGLYNGQPPNEPYFVEGDTSGFFGVYELLLDASAPDSPEISVYPVTHLPSGYCLCVAADWQSGYEIIDYLNKQPIEWATVHNSIESLIELSRSTAFWFNYFAFCRWLHKQDRELGALHPTRLDHLREKKGESSVINQEIDDYFAQIEAIFSRRRGKHILLSPLDWQLMKEWNERGIPLHIALSGINYVFDSKIASKSRTPVASLSYCKHSVEETFEMYLQTRIGTSDDAPELDETAELRDAILKLAKRVESFIDTHSSRGFMLELTLKNTVKALMQLQSESKLEYLPVEEKISELNAVLQSLYPSVIPDLTLLQ